ncbi:MAG: 2OG-Fe(II) oxygenase [Gemmataceae bacterium]
MGKSRGRASPVPALAAAVHAAARSAKFVVDGALPVADPGLVVEGIGPVPVPLKRGAANALVAACRVAPYGKGTQTLVDDRVRRTFELDPAKFTLGAGWTAAVVDATRAAAQALGLPADRLEARLYKLLVYERGGFFLPHRDSEKHDRMVASLIAVLPNPFEGGALVVRHGRAEQRIPFRDAATGTGAGFAAFYADCQHEVERVTSGVRLALAYNLVLAPDTAVRPATPATPADALVEAIGSWVARHPTKPLVFALDHHYTQRGLSLDLLKGADRTLAAGVAAAAGHAGCLVHLAQVSRHLTNSAFDGDDDYGRGYYDDEDDDEDEDGGESNTDGIEIGEVIDEELYGEEWADLAGKKQPWGAVRFDPAAVVSATPLDDWKPTSEEYEGYTGNAGNTLDRWYHRSAVVVWPRERHYDVVTRRDAAGCVPQFCAMVKKLAKAPRAKRDAARGECLRFARALVANWPHRYAHSREGSSPCDAFPAALLALHDRDAVAAFLTVLAERDEATPLRTFVAAACREFGWDAFGRELKLLVSPRVNQYGHRRDLARRDLEWLADVCGETTHDPEWRLLVGELCRVAVESFCERDARPRWGQDGTAATAAEKSLPDLLRALAAAGRDDDFARVVRFVREAPADFTLDYGQVPALKALVQWSRERFGSVYPPLRAWLDAVRAELERATAAEPTPPTDWTRPATVECRCNFCTQLNAFLADPTAEVGRIPASEDRRRHVIQQVERHRSDVTHRLERTGRPFTLVLTKTTGSYERAVQRYKKDCRLLRELPSAP